MLEKNSTLQEFEVISKNKLTNILVVIAKS